MKKYIISVSIIVLLLFLGYTSYFQAGIYVKLKQEPVHALASVQGKQICVEKNEELIPFEIRGVDLGAGIPGEWATDYAIDEETYLRWFEQIQALGANTIRVYTILQDDFYNAFYKYNQGREEPLYLLHGVWINDYMHNSHRDAYDEDMFQTLKEDCRSLVDILHGKKTLSLGRGLGSGSYRKDVSPWVLGYIIGVEWESSIVIYTNQKNESLNSYRGTYLYTAEDATAFEAMLCQAGDSMIEYESNRYGQQRLIAFSNWPTTDPFVYPVEVADYRKKLACVDVEKIKCTEEFQAGMFASYHVYPYFPDYLELMREAEQYTKEEIINRMGRVIWANMEHRLSLLEGADIRQFLQESDYYDSQGRYNTYIAYLRALNRYHSLPVVISEYGLTTGRGMSHQDKNTGRNQGYLTEQEQGKALVECYQDIRDAGCAGSCLFSWQDEWFKRTWNTIHAVDRDNTVYWSDYQTNEQFYGLLTFDPGAEESVCCVDGDISEWTELDRVIASGDMELSVKYDEKFFYMLAKKEDFDAQEDTLYIPVDTTYKSGSTYCRDYDVSFERASDFLVVIQGKDNSRIMVQQRYEALFSTYWQEYYLEDPYMDPPERDTPEFTGIDLPLVLGGFLPEQSIDTVTGARYETGRLRYGNADPDSEVFDSLADFIFAGDYVEIRIPWQLLNFSNPSEMMIHDDYYENYGIENLHIEKMYLGIGAKQEEQRRIPMNAVSMEGWGKHVTYHERLKKSYYILQEYWMQLD